MQQPEISIHPLIGRLRSVSRINLWTWFLLDPACCAKISSARNFVPTWDEVKSTRSPWCKHDSRFPPRHDKKHPVICYWVPALESYLIVQIWSDYAKPSSEKSGVWECQITLKNTPEIALWLSYFLTTKAVFLTPFLPVVLYLTTKNWVITALVWSNEVKLYQPV